MKTNTLFVRFLAVSNLLANDQLEQCDPIGKFDFFLCCIDLFV
jgi:hypothetical protein